MAAESEFQAFQALCYMFAKILSILLLRNLRLRAVEQQLKVTQLGNSRR